MSSFCLLSLALHATALSYPVLFAVPPRDRPLRVIILDSTEVSGDDARGSGGKENTKEPVRHRQSGAGKEPARITKAMKAERQQQQESNPAQGESPAESEGVALASYRYSGVEPQIDSYESVALPGNVAHEAAGTIGSPGGVGYGSANGTGSAEGGKGSLVGVSYADNPKPQYPHTARRQGQEGTVVLRVLVDEEGKSKSVEVNHSSGFEALDKAAMETVRRWRFHSARYSEKRVEMWVKIPIVFRLAD
jgi:TonB family protein